MLAQVVLLRAFLAVVEENELFLGVFFSVWFLGIFLGAWAGSRLKLRGDRLAWLALGALAFQAALFPVLTASIQIVRTTLALPASQYLGLPTLFLITLAHLAPFGFLTGLAFPLLCRLIGEQAGQAETAVGSVYGWEALGSLAAGAGFTFLLAGRAGGFAIGLMTAAAVALSASAVLWNLLERRRRTAAVVFAVAGAIFLALWSPPWRTPIERWITARWWRAYGPGLELRAQAETRYQQLAMACQAGQFSLLSNGRFVLSFPDPFTDAPAAHLMLAERPSPKRILLIGGLGRGLVKHWLLAKPLRIDVAEIDPGLTAFVRPWLPEEDRQALDDPRVAIHPVDGRRLIKRLASAKAPLAERYDLIVSLAPDPATAALNRFYTREFFAEARDLLAENGVLALDLSSAVNYFGQEVGGYVGSVYSALRQVFPAVAATPGVRTFFFASRDPQGPTSDVEALIQRWESMALEAGEFSPLSFYTVFEPGQMDFLNRSLERMERESAANTDLRPLSFLFALRIWNRFSGSGAGWLFAVADSVRWPALIVLGLALGAGWWALARLAGLRGTRLDRTRALTVVATTGASGIALSLLLLLAFQSSQGCLYRQVGLLAALFMAGLAAGALVWRRSPRRPLRALGLCEAALAAYALTVAAALAALFGSARIGSAGAVTWLFSILMILAGLFSGAEFAIAGHVYRRRASEVGRAGGRIDAADHLGASLGAFLATVVFLPRLGLIGALAVVAGLKALGLWVCVAPRGESRIADVEE